MKIGFMQGRLINSEKKNAIQFFPENNWKKEIELAKSLNLNLMEWTIDLVNIKKNPLFSEKKSNELKKLLEKKKIVVNSVTCDFFMQKPFFKTKQKKKYLNLLKKIILNGQRIGIKYFIIPLVDNSSLKNSNQENLLIKEMNKLSIILKKKKKFLFETDYKPKKIIEFIKKFNKKFGINYDTGNSASLNYKFDEEKKYFQYVHNIHIKDRVKYGNTVRLGKGNWQPKRFFKFLKKINYKKNLILQTARAKDGNHIREIFVNLKFIQKYI